MTLTDNKTRQHIQQVDYTKGYGFIGGNFVSPWRQIIARFALWLAGRADVFPVARLYNLLGYS